MDGSSWSDAYGADQLQTALATPGLTELWVGAGTYHPTTSADPNNRNAHFNLPDSLQFYGGFAGTETDLSQRDLTAHRTILSGNIGDTSVHTDNSHFLMNISGATYGILMDGLTLAYANNGFAGGALRISGGSRVEIADCDFHDNEAYVGGGFTITDSSEVLLERCHFERNLGGAGGGGIYATANAGLVVQRSVFRSNFSGDSGGAYFGRDAVEADFVNCLLDSNYVYNYTGGAIYLQQNTTARFTNCTVVRSGGRPAFATLGTSVSTLENCIVWSNGSGSGEISQYTHTIISLRPRHRRSTPSTMRNRQIDLHPMEQPI
ncbi:MAG: hypothetical protein RLY31_1415 [Bacteroidota bacterium]